MFFARVDETTIDVIAGVSSSFSVDEIPMIYFSANAVLDESGIEHLN